jgi:hypothetical protein
LNKNQSETKKTIKKEIYEIKDSTRYERGVEQRYEKPQKKETNRNPVNK